MELFVLYKITNYVVTVVGLTMFTAVDEHFPVKHKQIKEEKE